MTLRKLGQLALAFIEGGYLQGDAKLSSEHYANLALLARDFLIEQKKINRQSISQVMPEPKKYKLEGNKVKFDKKDNTASIKNIVFIDGSGNEMCDAVIPIMANQKNTICNSFFSHSIVTQDGIEVVNKPSIAKGLMVYFASGSSIDDEISNDIAFMVLQQMFNVGNMKREARHDTSNDMNPVWDYLKEQIRLQQNSPNNVN